MLRRYSPCSLKLVRVALPFGRPLPDRVGDPDARAAAEGVADRAARCVRGRRGSGRWPSRCSTDRPARQLWLAPMSPPVCAVERRHAGAVARRVAAGKAAAAAELGAELDVLVGRREPGQLHAVVAVLRAEQRLVGQRVVDEVPGVGVLRIEVADAGEEAAGLQREAVAERRGLDVGLLDRDRVVGMQRDVGGAAQPRIDAGGEAELGLGQAEAARAGADLGVRRQLEAGDRVVRRVARGARVQARQDQRHRRIEGVGAAAGAAAAVVRRRLARLARRRGGGGAVRRCRSGRFGGLQPLLRAPAGAPRRRRASRRSPVAAP